MIGYVGVDEQVDADFHRAFLKACMRRWKSRLRRDGARDCLLSFDEAKGALERWSQSYRGMRVVEVEKIIGSAGRCWDFDRSFLPLKSHMGERWGRIDRAYHRGVDLLPVISYGPPGFRGGQRVSFPYLLRDVAVRSYASRSSATFAASVGGLPAPG